MSSSSSASILDYPRKDLDPNIWENSKLKPDIKDFIEDIVYSTLDDLDLPSEALKDLVIYGSMLTNQYNEKTDVDCRIVLDPDAVAEKYPDTTGDDLFDLVQGIVHDIPLAATKHPLNCTVVIEGEETELGQAPLGKTKDDPVYDVLKDEFIVEPALQEDFDPDEKFEKNKEEAGAIIEILDELLREVKNDVIDYELIEEAVKEVKDPDKLINKLEDKIDKIEDNIEELVAEYTDIKDERTKSLSGDPKADWENSRHSAPGNVVFKYLERYQLIDVLRKLKQIFKDGVEPEEMEDISEVLAKTAMEAHELRKGMKFSDPSSVSVRDRDNWRWKETEITITSIRKYGEEPTDVVIYYKDNGGNKWKTDAEWFLDHYGPYKIEGTMKKLSFEAPTAPAVENTNPASIPRACPGCGYEAMGSACPKCGTEFTLNNAPDAEFLVSRKENSMRLFARVFRLLGQEALPFGEEDIESFFESEMEFEQEEQPMWELSPEELGRLEELQAKQARGALTPEEDFELQGLLDKLDKLMSSDVSVSARVARIWRKFAQLKNDIIEGMARAMFVVTWADYQEEQGESFSGMDLMDVAPETPEEAYKAAESLYSNIEKQNAVDLDSFVPPGEEEGFDAEDFGHYLAMEALGHGVAWGDSHEDHGLELPYIDFYMDGPGLFSWS